MDCHAFVKARNDSRGKPYNDRKKSVITSGSEVIHIHKFVNFLNNNVASAHCVHLQMRRKGVPEQDAKLQSTQWASQTGRRAKTTLLLRIWNSILYGLLRFTRNDGSKVIHFFTSINSDNLSRSNPCFVINNFIHKEDIHMRISKKILTIILSIGLSFSISCGDRPTGSTPGAGDTLISSTPNATGSEVKDFADTTYTGKLDIILDESEYTGGVWEGMTKEKAFKTYMENRFGLAELSMHITLTIANNKLTLQGMQIDGSGQFTTPAENEKPINNEKILLKDDGTTYNASCENSVTGKVNTKSKYYIEFTKNGNNITVSKFIEANSAQGYNDDLGNIDYGVKTIFKSSTPLTSGNN